MGGSFNPAHGGHLLISRLALKRLRLDEIWWLVSPGNPLKPAQGMAPFAARLAHARTVARGTVARDRRIRVSDLEARLGTRYTVDTLRALTRRFPRRRFVWIIGADNLAQMPRWHQWPQIFRLVRIAIFDRPDYSYKALAGQAAIRFAAWRLDERRAGRLVDSAPPCWVFLHGIRCTLSATAIRHRGESPFPEHRKGSKQ